MWKRILVAAVLTLSVVPAHAAVNAPEHQRARYVAGSEVRPWFPDAIRVHGCHGRRMEILVAVSYNPSNNTQTFRCETPEDLGL